MTSVVVLIAVFVRCEEWFEPGRLLRNIASGLPRHMVTVGLIQHGCVFNTVQLKQFAVIRFRSDLKNAFHIEWFIVDVVCRLSLGEPNCDDVVDLRFANEAADAVIPCHREPSQSVALNVGNMKPRMRIRRPCSCCSHSGKCFGASNGTGSIFRIFNRSMSS